MSHVLLGIIGVILFIGSAIAGAVFLGPAFFDSTVDSEAALAMQELAQISMAIEIRNAELETVTKAGFDLMDLVPDYLPDAPSNQLGTIPPYILEATGLEGSAVVMPLPLSNGRQLCDSLSRQSGGPEVAPSLYLTEIDLDMGCFRAKEAYPGGITLNSFVAYVRI